MEFQLFKTLLDKVGFYLGSNAEDAKVDGKRNRLRRFSSQLLSPLPELQEWIRRGLVERRTVHANVIWRQRQMILTKTAILFSRPDSDIIVDKILIKDVVSVCKVDDFDKKDETKHSFMLDPTKENVKNRRRASALSRIDLQECVRETYAFEIKVFTDNSFRSYFVRVGLSDERDLWIYEINKSLKSNLKEVFSGQGWLRLRQKQARDIYNNHTVRCVIACAILCDFLATVFEAEYLVDSHSSLAQFFNVIDIILLIFFCFELILNMLGHWTTVLGLPFVQHASNWFLLATLLFQLSGFFLPALNAKYFKIVRVVRIFDVGSAFRSLASCQMVIKALRHALVPVSSTLVILFFATSIAAVVSAHLFRDKDPIGYGTFSLSLFTMFQVCTGDGWAQYIARPMVGNDQHSAVTTYDAETNTTLTETPVPEKSIALYFISFYFTTCICLWGVVHAILVDEFMVSMQAERRRRREEEIEARFITTEKLDSPLDPLLSSLVHFHSSSDLSNKIRELFLMIDANGSGSLDYQEICDGLQSLEGTPIKLSLEDLDTLTENGALCNSRGELDLESFEALIRHQLQLYVIRMLGSAIERIEREEEAGGSNPVNGHMGVMLFVLKLLFANLGSISRPTDEPNAFIERDPLAFGEPVAHFAGGKESDPSSSSLHAKLDAVLAREDRILAAIERIEARGRGLNGSSGSDLVSVSVPKLAELQSPFFRSGRNLFTNGNSVAGAALDAGQNGHQSNGQNGSQNPFQNGSQSAVHNGSQRFVAKDVLSASNINGSSNGFSRAHSRQDDEEHHAGTEPLLAAIGGASNRRGRGRSRKGKHTSDSIEPSDSRSPRGHNGSDVSAALDRASSGSAGVQDAVLAEASAPKLLLPRLAAAGAAERAHGVRSPSEDRGRFLLRPRDQSSRTPEGPDPDAGHHPRPLPRARSADRSRHRDHDVPPSPLPPATERAGHKDNDFSILKSKSGERSSHDSFASRVKIPADRGEHRDRDGTPRSRPSMERPAQRDHDSRDVGRRLSNLQEEESAKTLNGGGGARSSAPAGDKGTPGPVEMSGADLAPMVRAEARRRSSTGGLDKGLDSFGRRRSDSHQTQMRWGVGDGGSSRGLTRARSDGSDNPGAGGVPREGTG